MTKPSETSGRKVRESAGSRPVLAAFAVLAMGMAVLAGCRRHQAAAQETSIRGGPVPVTATEAVLRDVPVQVQAIGWGEAYATVGIKARVEGQITELTFSEGQLVKAGDHLFTIDPRPFQAALHMAEANLARDKAKAEDARRDYDWIKGLFDQHTAAQRELDRASAVLAAAEATVRADDAAVEDARLRLEHCTIRSPLDGRAGDLLVDRGNIVKQNDTTLVVIDQLSPIYVTFSVAEQHLLTIKKYMSNRELSVEAAIPGDEGGPETGLLTFLDNRVDSTTGMVRLKATFQNEQRRLWPGQYVHVTLRLATQKDQVVVPTEAVQTGQAGQFVFVVAEGNVAKVRPVVPGDVIDRQTVLLDGLKAGETVVTDGQLRLVDGAVVDIKRGLQTRPARSARAEGGRS